MTKVRHILGISGGKDCGISNLHESKISRTRYGVFFY